MIYLFFSFPIPLKERGIEIEVLFFLSLLENYQAFGIF